MGASPVLSGELGLLSLFDLGQLFQLNGATGELCVTRDGRRGYLFFDAGQIVNAMDDEFHEGEGAAYRLFTWKTGTFEFRAQPASPTQTVTVLTEALMLEAARRMDELGEGGSGEQSRLKQRTGAFDALREAFQSAALEAVADRPAPKRASDSPLAKLANAEDVLVLRPGRRARLRVGGRWSDVAAGALDEAAWEQMRSRPQGAPADRHAREYLATGDDGRRYAVLPASGEDPALWVRVADVEPPALKSLPGGDAIAAQLSGAAGLLVVGAPDHETADRFFHACVAHLAATRGETVLLVSESARWKLADGAGAVIRTGPHDAEALLHSCAPGVAAFEPAHAGLAVAALGEAPLVVSGVMAPDSEAVLPAWLARAGRHDEAGLESVLDHLGASVLFASATDAAARLVLSRVDLGNTSSASRPRSKRAA